VTLQPKETKVFALKLNLFLNREGVPNPAGEPFHIELEALEKVDGWDKPVASWTLKASVVPTIRLQTTNLYLGTISDRQASVEKTVEIQASAAISRIECEAPAAWNVEIVQDNASSLQGKMRAVIRPAGKLSPRVLAEKVRFIPVSRQGERHAAKELTIRGEVVPDAMPVPREIVHGQQPCGTTALEAVRLQSLTNRKFHVKKVTASTADLSVTRDKDEQEGWVFILGLRFTNTGEQQVTATFLIQDEDGTEYSVTVPIRYHGVPSGHAKSKD
jgi:hypothetical protein